MISVIVPVYNIEKYLRRCLDSVINQTYRELEILIVDDGSTDSSGAICEEYGEKDNRIKVFHMENRGLSAARNRGLDEAKGEWIGFVDSDDWIEPYMYETLLNCVHSTKSDISCCGYCRQYANNETVIQVVPKVTTIEDEELISAAMEGNPFTLYAWNKLYKKELFDDCRFPEGMLFEDIATTWRLLIRCHRVTCVPNVFYHYTIRKDSIGNTKTMKNLADRWIAFKDRYDAMAQRNDELNQICTRRCLDTIGYTWRWLYMVKDRDDAILQQMRLFARTNRESFKLCSKATSISLFFALHSNALSIFICYYMNQIYRKIRGMDLTA